MRCHRCGHPVQPGHRNCGNCGASLVSPPIGVVSSAAPPPPPPGSSGLVVNLDDAQRREPAAWGVSATQGPEYRAPVVPQVDFESGDLKSASKTPIMVLGGLAALMIALVLAVVVRGGDDPDPAAVESPNRDAYQVGRCWAGDPLDPSPCDAPDAWQVVRFIDEGDRIQCPSAGRDGPFLDVARSRKGGSFELQMCLVPALGAPADQVVADGSCLVETVADEGPGFAEVPCDAPEAQYRVMVVSRTGCEGDDLVKSLPGPIADEQLCLGRP